MDVSNGGTALGIAVALGEIEMPPRRRRAARPVAVLVGRVVLVRRRARPGAGRRRRQRPRRRRPLPDRPLGDARRPRRRRHLGRDPDAGLDLPDRPHSSDLQGRLVNVFLKCEASQDGQVRGRRNAMLDDSDVHWHRQIKAARRRRHRRRSPATPPCSSRCRPPTRAPTAEAPSPPSSTSAPATRPATAAPSRADPRGAAAPTRPSPTAPRDHSDGVLRWVGCHRSTN